MSDIFDRRLERLEHDMDSVKATLARLEPMIIRIDERLPHLATKADLARIDERLSVTLPHLATKADLAEKPSKTFLAAAIAVLLAAYAAGLAALAALPVLRTLHLFS